jgi:hypothetical protein
MVRLTLAKQAAARVNLFNIEDLILRARSELDGFADKDCELFWSSEVL